jgi:hypothetical protein
MMITHGNFPSIDGDGEMGQENGGKDQSSGCGAAASDGGRVMKEAGRNQS